MVRKLLDLGIYIYFEKENINTQSMESELMLSILSGLAESESISISENNKWAVQRRFKTELLRFHTHHLVMTTLMGQMVVNPEQAEIVKYIFAEVLSGKGTQKVADDLNQMGIPTKRGARWTATTIRGILKNEKYTGDAILQKLIQIPDLISAPIMVRKININRKSTAEAPAVTKGSASLQLLKAPIRRLPRAP